MGSFSVWHWAVVVLVVGCILARPLAQRLSDRPPGPPGQPVFSSVVANGTEAEHLDDRPPTWRGPWWVAAVLFAMAVATAGWWWRS